MRVKWVEQQDAREFVAYVGRCKRGPASAEGGDVSALRRPLDTVVLLSGGLDSATSLAMCRARRDACVALTFRYGQRHDIEVTRAAEIARAFGAEHVIHDLPNTWTRGYVLGGAAEQRCDFSPAYLPARNTVFLAHGAALAEEIGARRIVIGASAEDSAFPDCRAVYFTALATALRLGTGIRGLVIEAPLAGLTKPEILDRAREMGVPVERTVSCYRPDEDGAPCRVCDACRIRGDA